MPEQKDWTGFALFSRDPSKKRHPKAPDYGGDGKLDMETVAYIMEEMKAGRNPKLEISGWARTGQSGTRFLSLKISAPYDKGRAGGQSQGGAPDDDIPF